MKAFELLKINETAFKLAQTAGLRLGDCRYVSLYLEYEDMRGDGEKVTYIVSHLAVKYHVSERTVYNLIKRMQCNIDAAGFD